MATAMLISACGSTPSSTVSEPDTSLGSATTATPTSTAQTQPDTDPDTSATTAAPTSTAQTQPDTDPDTSATTATPTSTADPQQETDRFFSLEPDATWQDVFDNLTTSEQSCIREVLGGELLDSAMAIPVFEIFAETSSRQWEVLMISCLLPESARIVFIPRFMYVIDRFFLDVVGVQTSIEEFTCMRDRVHDIGIEAVIAAFTEDSDAAATRLLFGMFTCVPDLLFSFIGEELGVDPRELSEDEKTCIGEWIKGIDEDDLAVFLSPDEDAAAALEFLLGIFACLPDLPIPDLAEDSINEAI